MATRKITIAPLAQVQANAAAIPAFLQRLATAYISGQDSVDKVSSLMGEARVSQLDSLKSACVGVAPIDPATWATEYAKPLGALLMAAKDTSGALRYADEKSVNPVVSKLKPVVLALTHGCSLGAAKTLADAATVGREFCYNHAPRGSNQPLMVKGKVGAPKKAPAAPKDAKPAPVVKMTAQDHAMALCSAMGSMDEDDVPKFAAGLVFLLSDDEGLGALAEVIKTRALPAKGRKSHF